MDPEPSVEPHFLKIVEAAEKSGIENVPLELETMRERLSHFKLNYEEIMGKQIYLDAILKNQVDESLYSEDDLSRLQENISAAKKKCKSKKEDVDLLKEDVKRHCEKVVSAWEEYIRSNESLKNQVLDIQKEDELFMRHVQDQLEEGAVSNSKRLGFHQLSSIEGHSIEAYNAVLDSQQVALRELLSELESIQKQIFTLEQQASITVHDINSCKFESNPPVGDDVESISKKNSKMILLTKMLEGLSGISILEQSKFHLKIKISPLSTQFCVLHVLLGNDGKLSSIMLDEEQSNFTPPQYLEEIFSCSIEDQDLSFSIREISHALLSKK